jgi:hypothetical protein
MVERWVGEVLFATNPQERLRRAKLIVMESYVEVETGLAMGLMRATYRANVGDLEGFLRREGVIELYLRATDGLSKKWLIKTSKVEELISQFREIHVPERTGGFETKPVMPTEQPTLQPTQQAPPPEQAGVGKGLSSSVKLALIPGRWTSAKLTLTQDELEVAMYEFMGMMARPTKVVVELKALKSFSRSDNEILVLHIESKPGYGLGDWYISTKQRDQWAEALLGLGIPETKAG